MAGILPRMPIETILILIAAFTLWNLVVFCVYAYDKMMAEGGGWRVREDTLILMAIAGGGIGAFACQRWMRHKTRKGIFPLLLPVMAVLHGVIAAGFAVVQLVRLIP